MSMTNTEPSLTVCPDCIESDLPEQDLCDKHFEEYMQKQKDELFSQSLQSKEEKGDDNVE